MREATTRARRDSIPTYELYGEPAGGLPPERMHCESIAERSRLHDWRIQPHRHEAFFQILYVAAGSGSILLENERLALRAPCVVTVPALSVHGFRFSRDIRGIVITMVEKHLDDLLAGAAGLREAYSRPCRILLERRSPQAAGLQRAFETVAREFKGNAPWRLVAVRAGLQLALIATARSLGDAGRRGSEAAGRKMRHLQRFRALVEQSFRDRRGVGYYAERIGVTPTQLNRICRDVLGKSALAVINSRLVREAERDLIYTMTDVKRIALSLGFADAAYFSRFFAKQTGSTPTEFRQAAWRRLVLEGRRKH